MESGVVRDARRRGEDTPTCIHTSRLGVVVTHKAISLALSGHFVAEDATRQNGPEVDEDRMQIRLCNKSSIHMDEYKSHSQHTNNNQNQRNTTTTTLPLNESGTL